MSYKNQPRVREHLSNVSRPDWGCQRARNPDLLWLDKNENMDPTYLEVVKRVYLEVLGHNINTYPETGRLYHKLANKLNFSPKNILFSAGSDGAIRSAFEAFVSPGDVVIYPQPTFAMYSVYAKIYEAEACPFEYETVEGEPRLNVEELINLIRQLRPKMLCLPIPDSPTGSVIEPNDLKEIIEESAKVNTLVLVDEAYYPFYSHTVLPWVKDYPNLMLTRSTGKAWGMAGFRLGYAVASESIIDGLQKVKSMYETNTLAFSVFERLLDFEVEMFASVERLEQGKQYFIDEMKKLGFHTLKGYGNFLHVNFGDYASVIHKNLEHVVYYRLDFSEPCLKGYSRFSSTTIENFIPVVKKIKYSMEEI